MNIFHFIERIFKFDEKKNQLITDNNNNNNKVDYQSIWNSWFPCNKKDFIREL
jgi:hypothetical protein